MHVLNKMKGMILKMKKIKAKLIIITILIIVILLEILSNFVAYDMKFKSIKFFYYLHSLKGTTVMIDGENTILINSVDIFKKETDNLFLKIDGKYQMIKNYDRSFIKNKECLDEEIFLFKYFYPKTGDFYLSVTFSKDKGTIQNDNFKCITKYNTIYCFSYIKNYEEPYLLRLGNKEYSIDLLSDYGF